MKLATHDSATGERSKNLLHSLFSIFAKTQTKTIKEQYEVGVRYFDLRVDKRLDLCHGLWKANKNLVDILSELKEYATEPVYITITIERRYSEQVYRDILDQIDTLLGYYCKDIITVYIAKKKPWEVLVYYTKVPVVAGYLSVPTPKQYLTLPFKDWRRYIPIPKYLKKITPNTEVGENTFLMVDFV